MARFRGIPGCQPGLVSYASVVVAYAAKKLADGFGDEVVAHGGAKHDVLREERAGELSGGFVDVDGGGEVASLCCGGEDVVDGLEDAADEALLNDNEDSVTVGVVEESRKDDAERSLCHSLPQVGESHGEVLLDIFGDADWQVVSHNSVDSVEKQGVLVGPMSVDGRAGYAGVLGDAQRGHRLGAFVEQQANCCLKHDFADPCCAWILPRGSPWLVGVLGHVWVSA